MVTLAANDGTTFSVAKNVAERSMLIKNMIEDVGESDDQAIPLPNINSNILKKVIEYADHHKDEPLPTAEDEDEDENVRSRSSEVTDEWDKNYINVPQEDLFEIVLAANYLDMKPLLDLGCKTIANMIKGKTPEEIRKIFNIENDFTPEEEEQIRKENEWINDA